MNVAAPPNLPPLPPVPNNGRGRVVADIDHQAPVLVQSKLGEVPHNYHSYSSYVDKHYTSCEQGQCQSGGREIWGALPRLDASGQPQFTTVTKHIDAQPASVLLGTAKWGALGALAGAGAGTLVGLFAGLPLGICAAAGAGAAAFAAGAVGGYQASRDRIRLEWQEKPVEDLTLAGYYHTVSEETRQECHYEYWGGQSHYVCRTVHDGWNHRFRSDVQGTTLATHFEPVVVHYQAS